MIEKLEEIGRQGLAQVEASPNLDALEQVRVSVLGKKGALSEVLKGLGSASPEERPKIGAAANEWKRKIETALEDRKNALESAHLEKRLASERIDISIPARTPHLGSTHILTQTTRKIIEIFSRIGFDVMTGPEAETDYLNFEAVNIPQDHPARDMQDTFFLGPGVVLRTHTSSVQMRAMRSGKWPVRALCPGAVYRCDNDATHSPMFHQVEGLWVDQGVKMSDLKGVLAFFAREMFGAEVKVRLRPSYFPFVEPGAEVDVSCFACAGKGASSCKVCRGSGWLEILGAGMVHPRLFELAGYAEDYKKSGLTGFAFGMGVERIAMLRHAVPDLRLMFQGDARFLGAILMKISWNWLSEMVDLKDVKGPQGLADLLTSRGLEVEEIARQDQGFEKVISAQILERNKHPEADRLSLCKVTIGSGAPLEIVCGAQNMKAGDKVALAQIGASLPNGLQIAQSKIRGVVSNGMLCSEQELKLKDASEGILILPPSTPLGKPLAEILGRDDTILTFKLTANRGDCLSHWGMAREVAAALGQKPKRPEPKALTLKGSPIALELNAGDNGPQFFGCLIEGVKIGPSPESVVRRLEALGSRSINNVVDATNLLMLELGQPVHAYDADRIEGGKLQIRMAKVGEKLPLLDGTEVTLAGTELVIGDGKRAVGLAGVMGGGNSEVQEGTKKVFLECAEFNPSLVRKASSQHQKKTDAAHRFERGIDPEGLPHAIARLAQLVTELAGGKIAGSASAQSPSRKKVEPRKITVSFDFFESFLGMPVAADRAEKILVGLGCQVQKNKNEWTVAVPPYRHDLVIREDLAEEIARSIGYGEIRETVPALSNAPTALLAESAAARFQLQSRAKDLLATLGLRETLNYGFTSRAWLARFGLESKIRLINPMSEEWELMTPSLLPGLVQNALDNWRHHFGSEQLPVRLFEIRPTFHFSGQASAEIKADGEFETGISEKWKLAFLLSGPRYSGGLRNEQGEVDFFDAKAVLENLFAKLGTKGVRMLPLSASRSGGNPNLHPGQSVEILAGNSVAGTMGLLHPAKARALKTRAPLWVAELDWEMIAKLSRPVTEAPHFKNWPEFPSIERDFALVVKNDVTADRITQVALKSGKPLAKIAKVFDIYQGSQVQEGMTSVAVRVIFYEESRSLQESEAEAASAQILSSWKKELGAELRS